MELKQIAYIETEFPDKFGIPRQSGLVNELRGKVVFLPEYRNADALRGIEEYSHLWLLWHFSMVEREGWSPTVRPPRLGGNTRVGVFATRSPYRPNPIGLSCVTLLEVVTEGEDAPYLIVGGADLANGTPIFDIKPYLPYVDSRSEAKGSFSDRYAEYSLKVVIPEELKALIPTEKLEALRGVLAGDPRPAYQKDPERVYGLLFADMEVRFSVKADVLTVKNVEFVKNS